MTDITIPVPAEAVPNVPVVSNESTPPAPEPAPEPVTAESADAQKPEGSDEGQPEQKKRPASERISQLYAQKKAAEADAYIAKQEALKLRDELAKLREQPIENLPFEQQDAARLRQVVKEERAEEVAAQAQRAINRAEQARIDSFRAKVDAAKDRMPDFDQVFPSTPISDVAAEIIAESEKAAEIAYWLGKNLNDAQRIYRLPPALQGAEIARIEARVSQAQPRKVSAAAPPTPQVSGQSSPSAKDPADMSMAEYAAWYAKRAK